MQPEIRENTAIKESWSVIHPLNPQDSAAMTTLRSAVAGMKGKLEGVAARSLFNDIMEHVTTPDGVSFEADTVGGISGWWETGSGSEGRRDPPSAWRLVQLGSGPGIPQPRWPHSNERRSGCVHPRLPARSRAPFSCGSEGRGGLLSGAR
jgi:hypothetical protein